MTDTTDIYMFNTWRINNGLEPVNTDNHKWLDIKETEETK